MYSGLSIDKKILCSTGPFTGRINGRNHRLLLEYADKLDCDGFEVLVFDDWYDRLGRITRDYRAAGAVCPVVHADKQIGTLMCKSAGECTGEYLDLWRMNCYLAVSIGAQKIVVHAWGPPDSNKYKELVFERCGELLRVAKDYKLDMVVENIPCYYGSPLGHLEQLAGVYPEMGFTIDTRMAQFHSEIEKVCNSPLLASGRARHMHISDYAGGHMDWDALMRILQPGKGDVDFDMLFARVGEIEYSGTLSLESLSVHREQGVNVEKSNECLRFIKIGLK